MDEFGHIIKKLHDVLSRLFRVGVVLGFRLAQASGCRVQGIGFRV